MPAGDLAETDGDADAKDALAAEGGVGGSDEADLDALVIPIGRAGSEWRWRNSASSGAWRAESYNLTRSRNRGAALRPLTRGTESRKTPAPEHL